MNKILIFLFISTGILALSIISISVAPIINDILDNFTTWGKNDCRYYRDKAKYSKYLDEKYNNEKLQSLCERQNAMYGLEYSSFIIDLSVGFICAQLALLHYFQIGKSFEKITGLIGLIGGAIGFILTLVYACYSGYIFNNDAAFKKLDGTGTIEKLYSNGAKYKYDSSTTATITVYSNDKNYDSQYIKYKDLADTQYNYNKKIYQAYYRGTTCRESNTPYTGCQYVYPAPETNNENKYLYDRWCLSLIFAIFISAANIALLIFGFLIFRSIGGGPEDIQEVKIE